MRRRPVLRLRGRVGGSLGGLWLFAASTLGASVAVCDELVHTASAANIPAVLLSLSLLAVAWQSRK
ncbi:MAG: hypothetical protein M3O06_03175 [Pseudomonadota bacterium]|nr:hypothetical protein [Pseudomonadota bacterium]